MMHIHTRSTTYTVDTDTHLFPDVYFNYMLEDIEKLWEKVGEVYMFLLFHLCQLIFKVCVTIFFVALPSEIVS